MKFDEQFEVVVIGGGHAGCEAASAAARLGVETALVTMNLDLIGQMSCNPAIGGIAKGHLVREIDALGGIMGRVADRTGIHFRLLNRSRGRAVQSPRAQADRSLYRKEMRLVLENTGDLHLRQGVVVEILVDRKAVVGVELQDGRRLGAKSVVVATGTFLNGMIHTGRRSYSSGRAGEPASIELSESLKRLGFPVGRLKTGTPPRLDGRSIDWSAFAPQPADEIPVPFSFATDEVTQPQLECFVGYTTPEVHELIRKNLSQSPLYSGKIKGIGPRYCPSIEDKVVKFAGKDRHQLFLEPEGHDTNEVYMNGFSTSLPGELQQELVRLIPGLRTARVVRPGYAIEYDFVDPQELTPDLQTRRISGLFHAGQINGTTGYEEAGCQGLIAGINAALTAQGRESFRLSRRQSYIGVLIDDLITQGVDEPYRVFTSRAENRLSLRYDNADERLSAYGRELGLVGDSSWERFNTKRDALARIDKELRETRLRRRDPKYQAASTMLGVDLGDSVTLAQLVKRPAVDSSIIRELLPTGAASKVSLADLETAMANVLYEVYIENQHTHLERLYSHDTLRIPTEFDFCAVQGLSVEMSERLVRARPRSFGDARRIRGLTSTALIALLVDLQVVCNPNVSRETSVT